MEKTSYFKMFVTKAFVIILPSMWALLHRKSAAAATASSHDS
jgi:hypothetical protein